MKIHVLHILDHSIPLHSGYTFRTRAIIEQQRKLGWTTDHITSSKHNLATTPEGDEETVDGLKFYRTPGRSTLLSKFPVINQFSIVKDLEARLLELVPKIKPDILHAHSPALNGLAALKVGARLGIPVVYEIRAFWEDAAVDHGTSKEGGVRYRLTRALETYVIKGKRGSGKVCLNGPAARKAQVGDIIIIISYASINYNEAKSHQPTIIFPDENNRIIG